MAEELLREGGPMEGFQLWVNLPAKDKMIAPRWAHPHSFAAVDAQLLYAAPGH
jgi:redox-sensitive bicupin YhaK (pirin superfamily)